MPKPSLGFQTTIETFQMRYYMLFYLTGQQNCQTSKLKVPKNSPYTSLNLVVLAVLMLLEIKQHALPYLKGLNSGLEP